MSSKPSTSRESKPSIEAGEEKRSESYLERGEEHGRDLEDWLQAERELASHEIVPLEE